MSKIRTYQQLKEQLIAKATELGTVADTMHDTGTINRNMRIRLCKIATITGAASEVIDHLESQITELKKQLAARDLVDGLIEREREMKGDS